MTGIRIGVLGCADIAVRRVLPALAAMPDAQVTVIASRDPAKAATVTSVFGGEPVHGYAAALDRDDVDAVYLPVPVALRPEWTERALLAGKHVLAEKPVTAEYGPTARLFTLARERGLALMENIMFVTHPLHREVRRLIEDGAIGALRSFHSAFTVPERAADDIRYQPALGGGALLDVGIYPVRAAMYFLGELSVTGTVLSRSPGHVVDTSGAILLQTPGKVPAQVTFGMENAYLSAYELRGDRGRVIVDRAYQPPPDNDPVIQLEQPDGRRHLRQPPADQVTATLARFVSAAQAGRSVDEASCLRQVALLEAVRDHAASIENAL
ncbi:MAG: gfo/Idh/MocA family oxidoreductase [Pseudonocardiaceae bacterium]|nr:gfo/Idh/MocA family oxidoreductase [Pseudonocardiaceae bacterium]